MHTQTIIKRLDDLKYIDENGDFIPTSFDNELETLTDSLMEDGNGIVAVTYVPSNEHLIAIVTYTELTVEQQNIMRAQKSGLSMIKTDFKK